MSMQTATQRMRRPSLVTVVQHQVDGAMWTAHDIALRTVRCLTFLGAWFTMTMTLWMVAFPLIARESFRSMAGTSASPPPSPGRKDPPPAYYSEVEDDDEDLAWRK